MDVVGLRAGQGLWSLGPLHRDHAGKFGHSRAGRDGAGIGRALCRIDAQIDDWIVLLVAATAATAGGMIGYIIGRWIGLRLLVRYGKYVGLDERRLKVGQYLFLQHGGKIVFFGRFVDLLRILAAPLAGANRMSWRYFLFMNALGGICWVVLLGRGRLFVRRGDETRRWVGPTSLAYRRNWSGSRRLHLFSPP